MAQKESNNGEDEVVHHNFKTPMKIRIKGPARESENKSPKRCLVEEKEEKEEEENMKKPAVKKNGSNGDDEVVHHDFKTSKKIRIKGSSSESENKSPKRCLVEEEEKDKEEKEEEEVEEWEEEEEEEEGEEEEEEPAVKKHRQKKRALINREDLNHQLGLNPPLAQLPQEFQDLIKKMNGFNIFLVAEKKLTRTDKDKNQGRFSVPRKQIRTYDFLTNEEIRILNQKGSQGIECSLIEPCLDETSGFEFKRWGMNKTYSLILIKNWNEVTCKARNVLITGCRLQLWSFRAGSELWFALVNLL